MRELRRLAWAAAFAAFAPTPAVAQTTGTSVGGTGTNLGTSATGTTATGTRGTTTGNTGTGGQGQSATTALETMQAAPKITGVSAYTTTNSTNTAVNASNFLRNVYANPYYQGRYNATGAGAPGGFGTALYPVTGTTTGGRGGQGGQGAAGTSGSINVQDPGGIIGTLPRQISYTSVAKFSSPPVVPAQLQSELTGMLSRTTMVSNPAAVQVVMGDGTNVVIRGTAKDADEARAIEGMIRMTPGVRQIKNELTYPKP